MQAAASGAQLVVAKGEEGLWDAVGRIVAMALGLRGGKSWREGDGGGE